MYQENGDMVCIMNENGLCGLYDENKWGGGVWFVSQSE